MFTSKKILPYTYLGHYSGKIARSDISKKRNTKQYDTDNFFELGENFIIEANDEKFNITRFFNTSIWNEKKYDDINVTAE